jgi:hypothetical protein
MKSFIASKERLLPSYNKTIFLNVCCSPDNNKTGHLVFLSMALMLAKEYLSIFSLLKIYLHKKKLILRNKINTNKNVL